MKRRIILLIAIMSLMAVSCDFYAPSAKLQSIEVKVKPAKCYQNFVADDYSIGFYTPHKKKLANINGDYVIFDYPRYLEKDNLSTSFPLEQKVLLYSNDHANPVELLSTSYEDGRTVLSFLKAPRPSDDVTHINFENVQFDPVNPNIVYIDLCYYYDFGGYLVQRMETCVVDLENYNYVVPGQMISDLSKIDSPVFGVDYAVLSFDASGFIIANASGLTLNKWHYADDMHYYFEQPVPSEFYNRDWTFAGQINEKGWPQTMTKDSESYELSYVNDEYAGNTLCLTHSQGGRRKKTYFDVRPLDLRVFDESKGMSDFSEYSNILSCYYSYNFQGILSEATYSYSANDDVYMKVSITETGERICDGIYQSGSGLVPDPVLKVEVGVDLGFFRGLYNTYTLLVKDEYGSMVKIGTVSSIKDLNEEVYKRFRDYGDSWYDD